MTSEYALHASTSPHSHSSTSSFMTQDKLNELQLPYQQPIISFSSSSSSSSFSSSSSAFSGASSSTLPFPSRTSIIAPTSPPSLPTKRKFNTCLSAIITPSSSTSTSPYLSCKKTRSVSPLPCFTSASSSSNETVSNSVPSISSVLPPSPTFLTNASSSLSSSSFRSVFDFFHFSSTLPLTLETLPLDLLQQILQWLSHPDLFQLLTVSSTLFPHVAKSLWKSPHLDSRTLVLNTSFRKILNSNHHFGHRLTRSASAVCLPYFLFITELKITHLPFEHQVLLLRKARLCLRASVTWTSSIAKALAEPNTCPCLASLMLVGRSTPFFEETKEYQYLKKVFLIKSKLTSLILDQLHICLLWILILIMHYTKVTSLIVWHAVLDIKFSQKFNSIHRAWTTKEKGENDEKALKAWNPMDLFEIPFTSFMNLPTKLKQSIFQSLFFKIPSSLQMCRISLCPLPSLLPPFFFEWIHRSPYLKKFDLSYLYLDLYLSVFPSDPVSTHFMTLFHFFPCHSSLTTLTLSSKRVTSETFQLALQGIPTQYQNTSLKHLTFAQPISGDLVATLLSFFPNLITLNVFRVEFTPQLFLQLPFLKRLVHLTLDLFDEPRFMLFLKMCESMPWLPSLDVYFDPKVLPPFHLFILIRSLPHLTQFQFRCPSLHHFQCCFQSTPFQLRSNQDQWGRSTSFSTSQLNVIRDVPLHYLNIQLKQREVHASHEMEEVRLGELFTPQWFGL